MGLLIEKYMAQTKVDKPRRTAASMAKGKGLKQGVVLLEGVLSKKIKQEPKQKMEDKAMRLKMEVEEVLGHKKGQGRTAAGKAAKAASTRSWKQAKRASKIVGVAAQEIEKSAAFLQEQAPLPSLFHKEALQLCRASLRVTLYKHFLITKAKGNGWKTQWGEAHIFLSSRFKLELAKHEAEASRCEVKLWALRRSSKMVRGPQLNPQGSEDEVGSALEEEWRKVAQQEVEETRLAIELLEQEVKDEIEEMNKSAQEALKL